MMGVGGSLAAKVDACQALFIRENLTFFFALQVQGAIVNP